MSSPLTPSFSTRSSSSAATDGRTPPLKSGGAGRQVTLAEQIRAANVLCQTAGDMLDQVEKARHTPMQLDEAIRGARAALDDITTNDNYRRIDSLSKKKVEALYDELQVTSNSAQRIKARFERKMRTADEMSQLRERAHLAGERQHQSLTSSTVGGLSAAEDQALQNEGRSIDATLRTLRAVNDASDDTLSALRRQGRQFEGIGGKLEGVLAGLGVGNQAIKRISSINRGDALIVVIGIALLTFLMLYLWFF